MALWMAGVLLAFVVIRIVQSQTAQAVATWWRAR
jgi:hypothetical protein